MCDKYQGQGDNLDKTLNKSKTKGKYLDHAK